MVWQGFPIPKAPMNVQIGMCIYIHTYVAELMLLPAWQIPMWTTPVRFQSKSAEDGYMRCDLQVLLIAAQ